MTIRDIVKEVMIRNNVKEKTALEIVELIQETGKQLNRESVVGALGRLYVHGEINITESRSKTNQRILLYSSFSSLEYLPMLLSQVRVA